MFPEDTKQKNWNFFRAGGVVQVELKSAEDLKRLARLDPKHWMALAMPVHGVCLDPRTLALLDTDQDGQVRPPEVIHAIEWVLARVKDLAQVVDFKNSVSTRNVQADVSLELEQITAPELLQCAQRIIQDLAENGTVTPPLIANDAASMSISLSMVDQALQLFKDSPLNGDGVITTDGVADIGLKQAIQWVIDTQGHVADRSGKPGMTQEKIEGFFAALDNRRNWILNGAKILEGQTPKNTPSTQNLQDHENLLDMIGSLELLHDAFQNVGQALDDYFDLCRLSLLSPQLVESIQIKRGGQSLESATLKSILQNTPLGPINSQCHLSLNGPLNPLWSKNLLLLLSQAKLKNLWSGEKSELTESQWLDLKTQLLTVGAWLVQKPQFPNVQLSDGEVLNLLNTGVKEKLIDLIKTDLQKANDYEAHADLQKLLLLKRDMLKLVQNFVNFSDFYRQRDGIFQIGTLYIDGRSTELCLEQINPTRHASLDALSGAFVVYCECTRAKNPPKSIIAIITDGEGSQMSAGRAGIFIDKQGQDWSALITKVIANPVSYREAFWSPYRRIVRWVEEQISKKMAASDVTTPTELSKVTEKIPVPPPATPGVKPALGAPGPKIDVGTVAALGVALGSIGTFVGMIASKFFDLGILMPFGLIAIGLIISGPSVVLAWFKLKNRNLAPILDANGWAINTRAIINVPFASSLTSLRQIPLTLGSVMPDPYAEKDRPWKLYWFLGAVGFVFLLWIAGYLDRFLPEKARFNVLISAPKTP